MDNNNKQLLDLELQISRFLRKGVFSAAVLMAIGWIVMATTNTGSFEHLKTYHKTSFFDSFLLALTLNSYGHILIYIGLIILIFLPIIRVLLTGILFLKQDDRILGIIAFIVLLILLLSFALGFEL